ncbi:MAG: preprotein translocase subunit SecA [Planctomycetes bacterium]|nr:preprotein translocase subunit SecA [Planctomycetota bacterium]
MEVLEGIWEVVTGSVSGVMRGIERSVTALFGSANARYVKRLQGRVDSINALESRFQAYSDEELRQQTVRFRERLASGETLEDLLHEAFAACRESGRRYLGMRHYDVQLIGGMVLHNRAIAEMVTGEGKTLVATLPAYLNAIEGKGVHVVTVNDYLARRDMEWMAPLYMGLGMTVGAIQSHMEVLERQRSYSCDITYGTNNEFGFDYLRDNMRPASRGDERYPKEYQQSQGRLNFAIIDEVDNILIDEARTPLIISGPAYHDVRRYADADRIARILKREQHFVVNEKDHSAHLTDAGVREAERLAGVESFYTAGNMEWPHLIDNALKAHYLYKRDVRYVVKDGKIIIVDEFTGRLMDGRQWSDGLHQAVEAKEGVKIKEETQTLATITLQNFFKLYNKICGMTGTAMTEANEFWKIYKLDVVAIPTNRDMRRIEHPDVIYRTEREKYNALVDEIERIHKWDMLEMADGEMKVGTIVKQSDELVEFQPHDGKTREQLPADKVRSTQRRGRPILVGTVSIEKSELIAEQLDRRGIPHAVLNAKHHEREASIIAQAGRKGGVTIATNMAGRGTDIILGGNPETMAWAMLQHKYATRLDVPQQEWIDLIRQIDEKEKMKEEGRFVKEIGGLHVIGTERHEARRIDLQLRGRCGRQGDPGSSRFYLSLEDDLMRIFAGPWVKSILDRLGMQEGESIESRMVSRRIEAAQKKVEERNFEIRKNLLEYDEVMDEQRKRIYKYRQRILEGINCRDLIMEMVANQVDEQFTQFLSRDFGVTSFAVWASKQLAAQLEASDFRGMDFAMADRQARESAERQAETQVQDAIDENLPDLDDGDTSEWNWNALANLANSRWNMQTNERDLRKVGRDLISEHLLNGARKAIQAVDLRDGERFLAEDYGLTTATQWLQFKFGASIGVDEIKGQEPETIKDLAAQRAATCYAEREAEYPILAAISRFTRRDNSKTSFVDGSAVYDWACKRFGCPIDRQVLEQRSLDLVRPVFIEASRKSHETGAVLRSQGDEFLERIFASAVENTTAAETGRTDEVEKLSDWLEENFNVDLTPVEIGRMKRSELATRISTIWNDRFHPEIRQMERRVLLQIVDAAWKEHLLVMDHLRSSVGLVGYAQVDPKVEYKREGMRLYEAMWKSIGERCTDLVFKVEQLDDEFIGSTWVETSARHDQAQSTSDIARTQQDAIQASQGEIKVETIRHRGERVGRNDACPCGSGRKYKQCCMRKASA